MKTKKTWASSQMPRTKRSEIRGLWLRGSLVYARGRDGCMNDVVLWGGTSYKNTLKGRLTGKIKTLNENFTNKQEQENKLEGARPEMERWQKLAAAIPANSLRDFALQTMFDLPITIANRQLSDITFRYALRPVDLKAMVVIDLWNAGEQRPVETLIRRRVLPGQPVAGPGTSHIWAPDAQSWNRCFWTRALAHWTARSWMPL